MISWKGHATKSWTRLGVKNKSLLFICLQIKIFPWAPTMSKAGTGKEERERMFPASMGKWQRHDFHISHHFWLSHWRIIWTKSKSIQIKYIKCHIFVVIWNAEGLLSITHKSCLYPLHKLNFIQHNNLLISDESFQRRNCFFFFIHSKQTLK